MLALVLAQTLNPWWPIVLAPPARFDHAYHGKLMVKELDRRALEIACGGPQFLGCTFGSHGGTCVVYLNRMYHNTVRKQLLRHEVAHCNGWGPNHEK